MTFQNRRLPISDGYKKWVQNPSFGAYSENKRPAACVPFAVAGAGFEPATSGL